jgi:cytochrome c oxidase cbb3-type subunit 3
VTDDTPKELPATASTEADRLLDHSYDGIQEYDNPMPRWWVLVFWGTFLFALGYFFHYQLSPNGKNVHQAYDEDVQRASEEMAARAANDPITEESLQKFLDDPAQVLNGQGIFQMRCVPCHESQGQGKIGPNLTDDHWIHGKGRLTDIYQVVNDGVSDKGMIAWGRTLKPVELRQVVAYVGSLRGKNLPGKAPEGTKVEPAR